MPEKRTIKRARKAKREGKSPSTQAGEFVHEEIEHVREGKHGARSTKQAIAIGLSKARRAGVKLKPPPKGRASASTRKRAAKDYRAGQSGRRRKPSPKRSRATLRALKREPRGTASRKALSRQAKTAARRRAAINEQPSWRWIIAEVAGLRCSGRAERVERRCRANVETAVGHRRCRVNLYAEHVYDGVEITAGPITTTVPASVVKNTLLSAATGEAK